DGNFLQALAQMRLYELGASLFSSALWIALPMIALLLFVNLTLGIISRVAPQMNIYAVGFPVTLTVGMLGIAATLPLLEQPVLALMQRAVDLFAAQRSRCRSDGSEPRRAARGTPRLIVVCAIQWRRTGASDQLISNGIHREFRIVGKLELLQHPRAVHTHRFRAQHQFFGDIRQPAA